MVLRIRGRDFFHILRPPTPWAVSPFFFQAEDAIRALYVTGVQTCALPISRHGPGPGQGHRVPPERLELARFRGGREIGRASCRERVYISVVAVSLKKK